MLTPEIIKIAHAYNKHDEINERKIHTSNVPRFGGLAVFFGFLIATLLFSTLWQHMINVHLIIALVLIVIIGFRDDFLPLKPKFKLAVEILASLLIIHFGNIRIESMHGLFGIGELPLWTSYGLTVFTLIVVTNAVNLIDGIDGLAGSFSLLVFGGYGCWFYSANDLATSIFCFGMVGAILGFLIFNYRTLIFMGDTGSLVIGFLAAAISLIFLQDNAQLPLDSPLKFPSPVFFICSILGFPLIDTIRVFAIRVASGRSPFSPDKNHLHHSLISLDLPHYQATAILCTTNMAFVGLAYLGQGVGDTVGILMATGLAFGLAHWLKKRSDAYLAAKKAGEPAPHIEVAAHPEPHPQEISL